MRKSIHIRLQKTFVLVTLLDLGLRTIDPFSGGQSLPWGVGRAGSCGLALSYIEGTSRHSQIWFGSILGFGVHWLMPRLLTLCFYWVVLLGQCFCAFKVFSDFAASDLSFAAVSKVRSRQFRAWKNARTERSVWPLPPCQGCCLKTLCMRRCGCHMEISMQSDSEWKWWEVDDRFFCDTFFFGVPWSRCSRPP